MELVCDECRDWPLQKRKVFVNYNNSLRTRREYKQRQARLADAASDQSVCDTDTDVPLDEPSVPVQNVHFDSLGQQQCLVSEEVVVSAGPSTEVAPSDVLLLPAGDSLDKLAASIFSRLSDLQSARGPPPPVQSHSVGSGISQQGVILPNVCQPGFADSDFVGVAAPPQLFPNPVQPVLRLPTAPVSGETPHRPVASDQRIQQLQENLLPLVRRSPRFAIVGFVLLSLSLTRPHRFPGTWRMLGNRLHGLGFRRLPSLRLPSRVLPVRSSTLLFLVHLGDGPLTRLSVPRDTHLARGGYSSPQET